MAAHVITFSTVSKACKCHPPARRGPWNREDVEGFCTSPAHVDNIVGRPFARCEEKNCPMLWGCAKRDKLYRLKHIPTGLYWRPKSRFKGNLSKLGKAYVTKPSVKWATREGIKMENPKWSGHGHSQYTNPQFRTEITTSADWEIEEI